jgi:hypothetical protein
LLNNILPALSLNITPLLYNGVVPDKYPLSEKFKNILLPSALGLEIIGLILLLSGPIFGKQNILTASFGYSLTETSAAITFGFLFTNHLLSKL